MRKLIFLIPFLLPIGVTATAADLTCTIPQANVARSLELCEELRVQLRIHSDNWDNDVCATQFFRMGLVAGERASSTRTAKAAVAGDVNTAVTEFTDTWPRPTPVACGDGTVDTEFGEECDDGNTSNGDGCSNSCGIE